MKTTTELINNLKRCDDVMKFLKENETELFNETTHRILNELLLKSSLSISEIGEKSGIGDYVYKVFAGTRNPSRNILIAISIAMSVDLSELQLLLRVSGNALLDPRTKRDAIIIFAINYKKSIYETEELLLEAKVQTLN